MKPHGVLYISYDGILEPLGQSQVLSYLERLTVDRQIHLITFEKPEELVNQAAVDLISRRAAISGIHWHRLRYHKSPSSLATAYDITIGIFAGVFLAIRYELKIVHARSYVPSVMALFVKWLSGARFIFDMRGFWADERIDGGLWPSGSRIYRLSKRFERQFLLAADHVVSLTRSAVVEIRRFDYLAGRQPLFSVIPTCADLDRFCRPSGSMPNNIAPVFTLGYVGAAGTWYLFDALVDCFCQLLILRPSSRLLILNRGEHDFIRSSLARRGVPASSVELLCADHSEVPQHMSRMDAAAFFIRPLFSKRASAPTKLGELLGCGVPCLTNTGVGDMAEILEGARVGVAVSEFDSASLREGLKQLLAICAEPTVADRCRDAAQQHFSLTQGVTAYRKIYEFLDKSF